MNKRTIDKNVFYVTNSIGPKRSTTPEGFLICHDVPIARTGTQMYSKDEIPVDAGPDGLIRIERLPEEVFSEKTIQSFEGKPVTIEHPNDFVTPENWKTVSVGYMQNIRRGEGIDDDLLIGDAVITDKAGIDYVNKELPEVSAGYDADYEQAGLGRGLQRNIVGNHVALVERGRAGPRCAIKDGEMKMKGKKRSFWDRMATAIKAKDAEAVKQEMESYDEEGESMSNEPEASAKEDNSLDKQVLAKLDQIAEMLAKMAAPAQDEEPEEMEEVTEDEGDLTKPEPTDYNPEASKVLTGDAMSMIIARSEILAPGMRIATKDSVSGSMADGIKRQALTKAMTTDSGAEVVKPFLAGRDLSKLSGATLDAVFVGASELMRAKNNASGARSSVTTKDFGRVTSVADINARNREFWAKKA